MTEDNGALHFHYDVDGNNFTSAGEASVQVKRMLRQMGVPVQTEQDEMTISGMGLTQRLATGRLLKGGEYPSYGDHRMVMALKVASLGADAPVVIDDVDCVAKSFPHFNEMFSVMTGIDRSSPIQ